MYGVNKTMEHCTTDKTNTRKPVTLRLDVNVIEYFKGMMEDTGIPYQSIINLYLKRCIDKKQKLDFISS